MSPVDEALVICEELAYIFCEKRLSSLVALAPIERVMSVVGRISARRFRVA